MRRTVLMILLLTTAFCSYAQTFPWYDPISHKIVGIPTIFPGNVTTGVTYSVTSTSAPAAPTVGKIGVAGTTIYGYKIALRLPTGTTAVSVEKRIGTSNAVLDGSNYNTVTVPTCPQVLCSFDVYVSTAAGNIVHTGYLATVASGATYNHQGADGDNNSLPATDTTAGIYTSGSIAPAGPTLVLYRCSVVGALHEGQLTTVSTECGTAVDTGIRVN